MSDETTTETPETPVEEPTTADPAPGEDTTPEDDETFPRAYVEKLRKESATYRERARRADDLAAELFTARVAATGRLADPTDLPFDEALLSDMPAMEAAIEQLIAAHPHYAARRPTGSIGQGATSADSSVDLAAILRGRA